MKGNKRKFEDVDLRRSLRRSPGRPVGSVNQKRRKIVITVGDCL